MSEYSVISDTNRQLTIDNTKHKRKFIRNRRIAIVEGAIILGGITLFVVLK